MKKKFNVITILALLGLIVASSITLGKAFAYFSADSSVSGTITMGHLYIDDIVPSDSTSTGWDIINLQPNQSFGGSYKVNVTSDINYYTRILFKASVTSQAGSTHINGTGCGDYVTDDTDILNISIDGTAAGTYQKSTTKTSDGYTAYYKLSPTPATTTAETFNIDLKVADWVGSGYCDYYMGATVSINMYVQVMQADYLEGNTIGDTSTADDMHELWNEIVPPPILDVTEYSNFTFTVLSADNKTMSVKKANTSITEANIPAYVKKDGEVYTITEIADASTDSSGAFRNCTNLTSITIPDTVASIGSYAFYSCKSLISITIPNSITSIGERAFYVCTNLTSVTIPNSVTYMGKQAFGGCTALTSIDIPSSVADIYTEYDSVFFACANLTSINIDSANATYSSINGVVFNKEATELVYCPQGKTSYAIPSGVTSIGDYAFGGCFNLTSITIPSSVTSIGRQAFYSCTALVSVVMEDGVTSIGAGAFMCCTSLSSITIPNSVTRIEKIAFVECTNLTSVTFENTEGWYVENAVTISDSNLKVTDPSTNATKLKSTDERWCNSVLCRR